MGRAFEKVSRQCGGGCAWSRARSNGHEPYLIANGVCGGADSATATVDGENCAGVGAERGCRRGGQRVIVR
jgi:hypothetical protein